MTRGRIVASVSSVGVECVSAQLKHRDKFRVPLVRHPADVTHRTIVSKYPRVDFMLPSANTEISSTRFSGKVRRMRSMILRRKRVKIVRNVVDSRSKLNGRRISDSAISFSKVTLFTNSPGEMQRFEATVLRQESVLECYQVMGEFDYLLKVLMPADVGASLTLKGMLGDMANVREIAWFVPRNVVSCRQIASNRTGANSIRSSPLEQAIERATGRKLQAHLGTLPDRSSRSTEAASSPLALIDMLANARASQRLSAFVFIRSVNERASTLAAIEFLAWHDRRILEFHQLSNDGDFLLKIGCRCITECAKAICIDVRSLPGAVEAKCYPVVKQVKRNNPDIGSTLSDCIEIL